MPEAEHFDAMAKPMRAIQIISAALCLGPLVFLCVTLFIPRGAPPTTTSIAGIPMLTFVAMLYSLMLMIARGFVLNIITNRERKQIAMNQFNTQMAGYEPGYFEMTGDAGRLLMVFQKRTIVGCALVEGAAFFTIIVYMLERSPIALGVAIALIVALVSQVPSKAGIQRWIEAQYQLLEQKRQSSPAA